MILYCINLFKDFNISVLIIILILYVKRLPNKLTQ